MNSLEARAGRRHVLTLRLTPEDHGRFLEVPFDVPAGTERVSLSCQVEGYEFAGKAVDLGLSDPMGPRGWSGGQRAHFWVERERATPGYRPDEIRPGRWAVILASNRIPPGGCLVTMTVDCTPERFRWLKGDLHLHSVHSDGAYELAGVLRLSEAVGLDFVGLTDHNTSTQNHAHPRDCRLICIPGMELTTYKGHCSLLGVTDPVRDFRISTEAELRERLREAHRNGAMIGLNHPFKDCEAPGCRWEWTWDVEHDWVEVWNGNWRQCNVDALDWWQAQLVAGRRVVAIGGSDTHRPNEPRRHGEPTNWVWSASASTAAILEATGRGHLFITQSPQGPTVDLRCGPYMMGDEVEEAPPDSLEVAVGRACTGDIIRLISERGVEYDAPIAPAAAGEIWTATLPVENRRFYRVEVWRDSSTPGQSVMVAMTNPIYFKAHSG